MRGSYYDVLGVSPTADPEEIRARYLLLMRRYHPDVNRSPLAHARAAQIGEAFQTLADTTLRARHDAALAQQRLEAVSARAVILHRGRNRLRSVAGRRGRLPWRYSGARLGLVALLVATAITGWQIKQRLIGGGGAVSPLASEDDTHSEARRAVAALNAASAREAQMMPPVSPDAVSSGVGAFRRIAADGDPARARVFSERCHAVAADAATWDALDSCVAFDQAAFVRYGKNPAAAVASAAYFVDRHDRAAHLYVSRLSSMDAIGVRLDQIRSKVAPLRDDRLQARTARMLRRIAKRGWKLATSARNAFDLSRVEQLESSDRARDF